MRKVGRGSLWILHKMEIAQICKRAEFVKSAKFGWVFAKKEKKAGKEK